MPRKKQSEKNNAAQQGLLTTTEQHIAFWACMIILFVIIYAVATTISIRLVEKRISERFDRLEQSVQIRIGISEEFITPEHLPEEIKDGFVYEPPEDYYNFSPDAFFNGIFNWSKESVFGKKCCYPLNCPQAKDNPAICDCIYMVLCEEINIEDDCPNITIDTIYGPRTSPVKTCISDIYKNVGEN